MFRKPDLRIAREIALRHVYWRVPPLVNFYHRVRARQNSETRILDESGLRTVLERAGISKGSLVMVHSALDGIHLSTIEGAIISSPLAVTMRILHLLKSVIGEEGTLAMPTHPKYKSDPGFMHDKSDLVLEYDPVKSASSVGLLSEIFRRQAGTVRSLHPLSSLCVRGPLASSILADNLNDEAPLPHGRHSSYYNFCKLNGTVLSIGLPLIRCMSIIHVVEEVRDQEWPVQGFFYPRRFMLAEHGTAREVHVRERRPEYVRSLALGALGEDLRKEAILNDSFVGEVPVQYAKAGEVFSYMTSRGDSGGSYPYFFPSLSRLL